MTRAEILQRLEILEASHAQLILNYNALDAIVNFQQTQLDRIAALPHNRFPIPDQPQKPKTRVE